MVFFIDYLKKGITINRDCYMALLDFFFIFSKIRDLRIVYQKDLCTSGAETRFSVTAESNGMLCIPLQRNIM